MPASWAVSSIHSTAWARGFARIGLARGMGHGGGRFRPRRGLCSPAEARLPPPLRQLVLSDSSVSRGVYVKGRGQSPLLNKVLAPVSLPAKFMVANSIANRRAAQRIADAVEGDEFVVPVLSAVADRGRSPVLDRLLRQ